MREVSRYRIFWAGLILKLACLPFWGSEYMRNLFIPFLDKAVLNVFSNPWSLSPPEFFPYGSVVFSLLFIPRYLGHLLFGAAALGNSPLSLVLIKSPLLLADLVFLWMLVDLNPKSVRRLLLYYWLNPILFFVNYIHGQLDLISMMFCFMAILLLIRKRPVLSGLVMAFATLSKFHVVIVIPLLLAYLWNNEFLDQSVRKILLWVGTWGSVTLIGFLPVLLANKVGYVTIASPQAQRFFGLQIPIGESNVFYIGVALVLLVVGRLALSTRITSRGLIYGCGAIFGLLLFVIDPAPGWFYWVIPFLAMYYSTYFTNQPLLFWALHAIYFLYFCVVSPFGLGLVPSSASLVLTLLQTSLLGTLIDLWSVVLHKEMPVLGRMKPVVIGVAGDSGVGKNTLSMNLESLFGTHNTVLLEGDDYHRWVRGTENWKFYTHLNPKANQLPVLAHHMKELIQGRYVFHPRYDHQTGTFTSPREIRPNKTVIIQGLHTLYLKKMRENFDLKIFMAPEEALRMYWKTKRDVTERGHSVEKIVESEEKRKPDAQHHIDPQKKYADWIIEYYAREKINIQADFQPQEVSLGVRHTLWNHAPVFELSHALKTLGACKVGVVNQAEDINRVVLEVEGDPTKETIEKIAITLYPNLRQLTRSRRAPQWAQGLQGINQLVTLALLQGLEG